MTMTDLIMAGAPRSTMAARLVSLCWRPNVECYYFGYAPMGGRDTNVPRQFDCMRLASALGRNIDGGLCCWLDTQTEGQALRDARRGLDGDRFLGSQQQRRRSAVQQHRVHRPRHADLRADDTRPAAPIDEARASARTDPGHGQ